MIALIIAAGEGSRLKNEGLSIKKPLIQVQNQPIIRRLIELLRKNGFEEVHIIINEESKDVQEYLDFMINEYLEQGYLIKVDYIVKSTPSSLHSFYELIKHNDSLPFYLFTVDSIFKEKDLAGFMNYCNSNAGFDAIMGTTGFIDDEKPLYVEIQNNSIIKFSNDSISKTITSGLYYFNTKVDTILDFLIRSDVYQLRSFLMQLAYMKLNIGYFNFDKVIDVDHISDLVTANRFLEDS